MTKQEVRAAALGKLAVGPEDVCWDIGAGTGSVSVELALQSRAVWAVERDPEALALLRANRERFCAWNLRAAEGSAPEALAGLPVPDAVFVGGSGGELPAILQTVRQVNPRARVCVSAIALETLHTALEHFTALGYETETAQIAVSRCRPAGKLHLLTAQNPVFLITGGTALRRLMLTAMASGSGKTTVTCALLSALGRRGISAQSFKCGPDYIDPMFHTQVLGIPSRNLDLFLQGPGGLSRTLARQQADFALVEGAMGFYDGVGGGADASAWQTADAADIPAVLVLRPAGASLTLAAQVRGLQAFRSPSHLAGLLLNNCKPMLHAHLAPILERETGLPVLGYLPPMEEAAFPSRHLGLLTAGEIADLSARIETLAAQLERTVDIPALLALAGEVSGSAAALRPLPPVRCRIAVARDEAFCFLYEDNLDALRQWGAEPVFFSPLRDGELPRNIDGLYLAGGYPELHAQALSENRTMRQSICRAVTAGLPTVAECGGFLYLQTSLEDEHGTPWPMTGALPGQGFPTGSLRRFGYVTMTAEADSLLLRRGETVPAHEFHYWDCTKNGAGLTARKAGRDRSWRCGFVSPTLYAAFPHLHFNGELPLARRFADQAARRREERL